MREIRSQLGAAYRWLVDQDGAYLRRNYGSAATVTRDGDRWLVTIVDTGSRVSGPAASLAQGMRHAERWIAAAWRRPRPVRPRKRGRGY